MNPTPWYEKGVAHVKAKRYAEALHAFLNGFDASAQPPIDARTMSLGILCLLDACRMLVVLGRAAEAREQLVRAEPLIQPLRVPPLRAQYYSVRGFASTALGSHVEALAHFSRAFSEGEQATGSFAAVDFRPVLAGELTRLVRAFAATQGRRADQPASPKEMEFYRDAAALANRLRNAEVACVAQTFWGNALHSTGQYQEAHKALSSACADLANVPAPNERCAALLSLGLVLSALGRPSEALDRARQAASEADRVPDEATRCQAWVECGKALFDWGDWDSGLRLLEKADEGTPDSPPAARHRAAEALGARLLTLGRRTAALRAHARAAEAAERMEDPQVRCNAYLNFAGCLLLDDPELARQFAERAGKDIDKVADLSLRAHFLLTYAGVLDAVDSGAGLRHWKVAAQAAEKDPRPKTRCTALILCAWRLAEEPEAREEARKYLQLVEADSALPSSPLFLSQLAAARARLAAGEGQWKEALDAYSASRAAALGYIGQLRWWEGVDFWSGREWCDGGVEACGQLWKETADRGYLWQGIEFIDSAKCIGVREATGRHLQREKPGDAPEPWQAGPGDWRRLFPADGVDGDAGPSLRVRGPEDNPGEAQRRGVFGKGLRAVGRWLGALAFSPSAWPPKPFEPQYPQVPDTAAGSLWEPLKREEVGAFLDEDTAVLLFYFRGLDLLVAPVRRSAGGSAEASPTETGYFALPGVAGECHLLAAEQQDIIASVRTSFAGIGALEHVYRRLGELLQLDRLLPHLEPDPARRRQLHLVLIPDGPLYALPLHAAQTSAGVPLYEQVASVRYGLSLAVLAYQRTVEAAHALVEQSDRPLRGVLFANPNRAGAHGLPHLPGVVREVEILLNTTGPDRWMVHGESGPAERRATLASFRRRHGLGNVLWCAGHGGMLSPLPADSGTAQEPAFLLCDGVLSVSELMSHPYDFRGTRLLSFASCLLGKMYSPHLTSKEIHGFLAALTLRGARRTVGALWQIPDEAAVEFFRHWVRALSARLFQESVPGPHAFARAFREATDAFRQSDGGRYNHAYFWSPYLLYGLG
jgi:tetratricopeptide (TPR) repeat protein/CHAT domain-containing protein